MNIQFKENTTTDKACTHKEQLAYEYCLGLINKEKVSDLLQDSEFIAHCHTWRVNFTQLNAQLDFETSSVQIWRAIEHRITPTQTATPNKTLTNILANILTQPKQWLSSLLTTFANKPSYGITAFVSLSGILLVTGIVFTQIPQINAAQLDWNIKTNLAKNSLAIDVKRHHHIDKNTVCVLWVTHNNTFVMVGKLPETGQKNLPITPKILAMMQSGNIVVSVEKIASLNQADLPTSPSHIEFNDKWL